MIFRASTLSFALSPLVAVVACSAPTTEPTVTTLRVPVDHGTAHVGNTPPAASASALASVSPVAPPPQLPVRSATPGRIQCGTVDCDVTAETCCFDEQAALGRCLPRGTTEASSCKPTEVSRACDEAADCGAAARCCLERSYLADDGCESSERWRCQAGPCDPTGEPSSELCLPGSSCARGACLADESTEGWPLQGRCPLDTPAIACGGKTCAEGESCCFRPKTKTGTCVKSEEECSPDYATQDARKLFHCRSPEDCGGGECFSVTGDIMRQVFSCGELRCNPMVGIAGPYLCKTRADCAPSITLIESETTDRTYQLTGCNADPGYPSGIRVCQYR